MSGTLSLSRDGDQASLVFQYDNFTRNKGRNDPSQLYYTFALEGNVKCHVPAAGAEAIVAHWPGKGGGMTVVRHAATQWEVRDVHPGDTQYPLKMKEWNNAAKQYVDVDWAPGQPVEPGSTPQAAQQPAQAPSTPAGPPPQAGAPQTQQTASPALTWEDLQGTWEAAWGIAWASMAGATLAGDHVGAVERAAVTIYMDARRQGLTTRGPSGPETGETDLPPGF